MKWFGRIALALLLVAGVFIAVGLLLPSGFKVQRTVEFAVAPERIYPLIADPREWKRWSVWNRRDPAMTMEYAGAPSGTGARWAWKSASEGNGEMEFTRAVSITRVEYTLRFPDMGMRSNGQLRLEPQGNGTREKIECFSMSKSPGDHMGIVMQSFASYHYRDKVFEFAHETSSHSSSLSRSLNQINRPFYPQH